MLHRSADPVPVSGSALGWLRLLSWSFLTNHALVLIHISRQPESTGLEIAQAVGVTERATRKIVGDLEAAGYIAREKMGRRNRYRVDTQRPITRIGERDLTVGQILEIVSNSKTPPSPGNIAREA